MHPQDLYPGVRHILATGDPRQTARARLSADSRQQVQSVCVPENKIIMFLETWSLTLKQHC